MKFSFKQFIVPNFGKRLAFMLPAIVLMGVFLSVLIEINWGTDPASFMNLNIAHTIHLSLGNTQVIVYGIMFIFTFIFGAEMIGFGTLANMLFIGYIADFCRWLWNQIGFHDYVQTASLGPKIGIFAIAILLFVLVAAIYMNAEMGVAPYDACPVIINRWCPKVPYAVLRIVYDLSAVVIGVIASRFSADGIQGSIIGSIVMSLAIGPAVQLMSKPLSKIL